MKKHNRPYAMVFVSLFLGMTALLVSFGAAAAFETRGGRSNAELIAPCVAAALYLAFCQFWVAPRGSRGFWAKLPTLVASVTPLLVGTNWNLRAWGIPWLASGCLGSVIGAMIAQRVTATPQGGTPTADSSNRGRSCRNYLLVGFILLVAIALVIPIGVIPSVLADTAQGFNAGPTGGVLGITVVVFDLMAVAILASALWRPRERDPSSKGTLGTTAFLALWLGLAYGAFGIGILVGELGPGLRIASVVLVLCAVCCLITTALMTVTSVIVDRARLSNLDTIK